MVHIFIATQPIVIEIFSVQSNVDDELNNLTMTMLKKISMYNFTKQMQVQTYILLHSIKFFGLHQLFGIHTVGCTSHALFMLFSHNGYIENQSGSCRCQRLYSLGFLVVLLDLEGLLLPDNEKTASAKGQLLYACLKLHYITSLQYAFGHSACV